MAEQVLCKSYIASADLSSYQYRFVKLASDTTIAICGAGEVPLGILQNDPESGEVGNVMILGISKLNASAAISRHAYVASAANGQGVATTTDDTAVGGMAIEAATADGDEIDVILTPGTTLSGSGDD